MSAPDRSALWRMALGLVTVVAVYALGVAALIGLLRLAVGPDDFLSWIARVQSADGPEATLMLLATFSAMIAGTVTAGWLLHRKGLFALAGAPRALARHFALGAGVGLSVLGVSLALYLALEPVGPGLPLPLWLRLLPVAVAALMVQTFAEELLFRGYLQGQLRARFASPLIWVLVPALLFGAAHFDPAGAGDNAVLVFLAASLFGLFAADLTARSGTIGLAWGFHFANNAVALLAVALPDTLPGLALGLSRASIADSAISPLILQDMVVTTLIWAILRLVSRQR